MCEGRNALVTSLDRQTKTAAPPKLYDLTTLQRDANRLFGYTAAKTLECAQALYENKLITYPRTDSNYLTDDMEQTARNVIAASREVFPFLAADPAEETGRLLNSKKVSDHHAIIPTVEIRNADLSGRSVEEKNVLIMVAARLVCAAGRPHVYETVKAALQCCGYSFSASGRSVKEPGWKAIEEAMRKQCRADAESETDDLSVVSDGQDLSALYQGASFSPVHTKVSEHWTQPPKRYTEDTLLAAMERAGSSDMEADVERKGLGTPATRASIIDKLIQSGYAVRKKKQVIATDAGRQLISVMPEYLKSVKMTADWENQLLMIERGQYDNRTFMNGITGMLQRMLEECRQIEGDERNRFGTHKEREAIGTCPVCGSPVYEGKQNFYCSNRDCRFVLWKENRYLERMQKKLDAGMAKDLLAKGRTRVKDLYSAKKDKLFTADLLMEWKDGRAMFSLDFPKTSGGRQRGARSR
jgi:DNA topoisomerase-3